MSRATALVLSVFVALSAPSIASAQETQPVQPPAKRLTVDAIFAHGPIAGNMPEALTWSPDGKHLTYQESGQLMDVDPATGKAHVLVSAAKMAPLEENGGSERERDERARYGAASYYWSPDSAHLLFDANGRLWIYDLHTGVGVQIGFTGAAFGDDPKFSPDGSHVSYLRDHGLHVIHLQDPGMPMQTLVAAPNSTDASGPMLLNGEVDWVYEEELDTRSNYFWSPDSKYIAYLQMNETHVPQYPIEDWIPRHAQVDWQRYPQAGDPNPEVRVGVVSARGGKTTWIPMPIHGGDDYIPRFGWADRKTVWVETLSRDHKHRAIYFAHTDTADMRQMLEIDDDKFVDENYDVAVADGSIVLTSWSDGHTHIDLYSYDKQEPLSGEAKLEKQLTQGDFEVGEICNIDTARKLVDYSSNEGNPQEQQIWEVSFNGDRRQLSAGAGTHQADFAPGAAYYTDKFSTRMKTPEIRICRASEAPAGAGACRVFWQTHALDAYHLRAPEQLTVKAQDGTTLYATLLLPEGMKNPATVPLIVNPYGGPHEMEVANKWSGGLLFDELLAQHGFAVLHADNRGMGNRGRAFTQAAYHNFGPVQLEDQLTVIDAALVQYPQLDGKRMGWWGWSWGGTFTLYAMTHSDRFRAGVAVAPVTDWHDYDSIYTERYMGLPAENPEGYRDNSVVNSAMNLKGRLLLVHGTGDDNVHMENSVQFIQKLIDADIPYDLMIYPRKTHSLAGPEAHTHLFNRILEQFETVLKPEAAGN